MDYQKLVEKIVFRDLFGKRLCPSRENSTTLKPVVTLEIRKSDFVFLLGEREQQVRHKRVHGFSYSSTLMINVIKYNIYLLVYHSLLYGQSPCHYHYYLPPLLRWVPTAFNSG